MLALSYKKFSLEWRPILKIIKMFEAFSNYNFSNFNDCGYLIKKIKIKQLYITCLITIFENNSEK